MDKLNQTIGQPFKVICVNDTNLDDKIDPSQSIKFGEEHIVTNIYTDIITGKQAFVLLDKEPYPHKGFRASRFQPTLGSYISYLTGIN